MTHVHKTLLAGLTMLLCLRLTWAAGCEDPKTLRFSLVPMKDVQSQFSAYRPLIQILEKNLRKHVEIVHASSYGAVVEGLLSGSIDLAELGAASYAQARHRDPGITAFASPLQLIGPDTPNTISGANYQSLLIVRPGRGFDSIASLRGASLSLIDPASTSGGLIPRQAMVKLTGQSVEQYFGRVTYAGSHDRAIQAVQKGVVDAAFVSSSRLDEALRLGSLQAGEVSVTWKSEPIPYDPFVYRGQLCPSVTEKIKRTFFLENTALQDMFKRNNLAGFARVSDEQYKDIRVIYAEQPQ